MTDWLGYDTGAASRSGFRLSPPSPQVGTYFANAGRMSARIHPLFFGLALASVTSLGCGGNAKSDAAADDAVVEGAACDGSPINCVQGGPSGTGVACGGFGHSGTCVAGVWTCPTGMVDTKECTCGEPGISCTPQVCTKDGPVCLDAGVDG